jgi:hypothetical protein
MSSSGEMKMSLRVMTCTKSDRYAQWQQRRQNGTHVFVLEMLEQLELSVCALREDGSAEGLHDLLDCDILVGELIAGRAVEKFGISETYSFTNYNQVSDRGGV